MYDFPILKLHGCIEVSLLHVPYNRLILLILFLISLLVFVRVDVELLLMKSLPLCRKVILLSAHVRDPGMLSGVRHLKLPLLSFSLSRSLRRYSTSRGMHSRASFRISYFYSLFAFVCSLFYCYFCRLITSILLFCVPLFLQYLSVIFTRRLFLGFR